MGSQHFNIQLGALDMIARIVIPDLGEGRHRHDADFLNQRDLLGPPRYFRFKKMVLVFEKVSGLLKRNMGLHPREQHGSADRLRNIIDRSKLESQILFLHLFLRC
ncbi:hypothetical protein D3C71_1517170 [compost metagenome]